MSHVPLDAKVVCTDGPCGKSVTIIANPVTRALSYIVVEDAISDTPVQRLVPVEQVAESTTHTIYLSCTQDEFVALESFVHTEFVMTEETLAYPTAATYELAYVMPVEQIRVPVDVEHIPPGELAIRRGTRVKATDGSIGTVGELMIDPASGNVTHLVILEGHFLGKKKELALPLSAVDRVSVDTDTVHLKLDKKAIQKLPHIPVKRRYAQGEGQAELAARVFDDPDRAREALEYVEDLHRRRVLRILNAAVMVVDEDGNATIDDTRDIEPKKGRLMGAITGGLIGLVGGPIGVIVGALAGLGAGGLAARLTDFGFSDKFLAELQEHLKPGSSALIVLVEHEWARTLSESMADLGGWVFEQPLTDELVEQLMAASEDD